VGAKCELALEEASRQVGPHNVYDLYDNCPRTREWLQRSGKSMRWLTQFLRGKLDGNVHASEYSAELADMAGGYDWGCDGLDAMATFFKRADVQKAMHLQVRGPPEEPLEEPLEEGMHLFSIVLLFYLLLLLFNLYNNTAPALTSGTFKVHRQCLALL
jgi:hypothetical protein